MAKIQTLLDDGVKLYPKTVATAVYMSDGTTTVEEKLSGATDLDTIKENALSGKTAYDSLSGYTTLEMLKDNEYVVAGSITNIEDEISMISGAVEDKQEKLIYYTEDEGTKKATINADLLEIVDKYNNSFTFGVQDDGIAFSANIEDSDVMVINGKKILTTAESNSMATLSSITSLPISYKYIIAEVSSDTTFGFSTVPSKGSEIHTIIRNTGNVTITIAMPDFSEGYIHFGESSIDLEGGEYGEINAISDGTTIYLRGAYL